MEQNAERFALWSRILAFFIIQPIFAVKVWQAWRHVGGARGIYTRVRSVVPCRRQHDCDDGDNASDVQDLVDQLFDVRRVSFARTVIACTWTAFSIFFLLDGVNFLVRPRPATTVLRWVTCAILWGAGAMGVYFPKRCVTIRTLPYWMWAGTAVTVVMTQLAQRVVSSREILLFSWPCLEFASVSFCCIYLHFPSLAASGLCITVGFAVTFHRTPDPGQEGEIKFPDVLVQAGCLWVWKLVVFCCLERACKFSVRKEVEAVLGKCHGTGVSALLELVCDVVVDLNHDFMLKDHSNKLAGLLMHGSGKSLRGLPFCDFIAPGDDRQRLEEFAGRSGASESERGPESMPHMMRIRLRDSMGNLFGVVLYHMPYMSIHGRLHHLIGLQEASEGAPIDAAPTVESDGEAQTAVHPQRPMPEATLRQDLADALSGEGGGGDIAPGMYSRRASCASPSLTLASAGEETELGSLVVFVEEGLPIVASDEAVRERLGLSADGGGFVQALPDQGKELAKKIIDIAGRVLRREQDPFHGSCGVWRLAPPGHRPGTYEVCVEFRSPERELDPSRQMVKIRLLVPPPPRSHTRRSKRTDGTGSGRWRTRIGPLQASSSSAAGPAPQAISL